MLLHNLFTFTFLYYILKIIKSVAGTETDSDVPRFQHGSYGYFIKVDVKGLIGIVEATVDDPAVGLTYYFETDNEILQSSLKQNPYRGIIDLGDYLPPDIYEGVMYATNNITGSVGSADVMITVELEENCPVDKVTTVKKTLVVRELREEESHSNIWPSIVGDCNYFIEEQWPPKTSFFQIDEQQKFIKCSKFDRESEIFANESIPQFRITLKLVCPMRNNLIPSYKQNFSHVLLRDIEFSMDTTILSIIIEDVNDNKPKFVHPEQDVVIGYPSSEVAQKILPDNLCQVHAIDIDEGFNAKIAYRIDTNSHFTIDKESGIIAPLPQAMHDVNAIDLTVRAYDRDGENGANSAVVKIKVMKLLAENLVWILYENVKKLSHEEVLEEICRESMMKLLTVKMTTIPKVYNDSDVVPFIYEQKTYVNLIGYALNIKTNRPMANEDIMRILAPLEETIDLKIVPLNEMIENNCEIISKSNDFYKVLFIIFASILGSVIFIIIVVIILVYSYLIKPFKVQAEVDAQGKSEAEVEVPKPTRVRHPKYQKSGDKRVSFGTTRRLNDIRPIFDSEDDRRFSWSESVSSVNSESDNQRRETQNLQFQAFMKKFDRLEGDGSEVPKGLDILAEEK